MKYTFYIQSQEELQSLFDSQLDFSIVLAPKKLSRYGKLEFSQCEKLRSLCEIQGVDCHLELDRILTSTEFKGFLSNTQELSLNKYKSIRCIDPGLAEYLSVEKKLKISFIAEMGNHNIKALKEWEDYFDDSLETIILCPELDKTKITEFNEALNTKTELLAFGKILLFYTPRHLLSPYYTQHDDPSQKEQLSTGFLQLNANSEESPHKGFGICETPSGTYMFNPKDLSLFDYLEELKATGLDAIRIDLRDFNGNIQCLKECIDFLKSPTPENLNALKAAWPRALIRGFFLANKSDVLFKNLKNQHNLRQDENFIGDIIETESGNHCVLEVKNSRKRLHLGDRIHYKTPDKKWKQMELKWMKNLKGNSIETAQAGDFVVLAHSSGVSSNTRVYWDSKND